MTAKDIERSLVHQLQLLDRFEEGSRIGMNRQRFGSSHSYSIDAEGFWCNMISVGVCAAAPSGAPCRKCNRP